MDYEFSLLRRSRTNFLALMDSVSPEQAATVPAGFNNNILWNAGHVVATQKILCYKLSGLPLGMPDDFIEKLRKGTSPKDWGQSPPDAALIRESLLSSVDQLRDDYKAGRFQNFTPYETSFGIKLETIEEAIRFNNVHESLHLGYAIALKRAVLAK
jgi:hypothetical protein